jgi:hypothetical protein
MIDSEQIMSSVREKYARCNSYCDRGYSSISSSHQPSTGDECIFSRFETSFLRPNNYQFIWEDYSRGRPTGNFRGIWSNGEHTRVKDSELKPWTSLPGAILSHGSSSQIVAALLLTKIRLKARINLLKLADCLLIGEEQIGSQLCYVLAGRDAKAADTKIWISKAQSAIIRVDMDHYTTAGEKESSDYALIARENILANKLNRPPAEIPENKGYSDTHMIFRHEYVDVIFDSVFDPALFDFPNATEI